LKNQFEVFSAVLNQFSDAELALTYAIDSQNSAWDENSAYMNSIEAKQQALSQQISKLVLNGGLQDLYKMILNLTVAFLKFANSGIGQTILKMTAVALGLTALNIIITKTNKKLAGTTAETYLLNLALGVLTGDITLTNIALGVMNGLLTVIEAHPIIAFFTILTGAITATVGIIKHFVNYQKQVAEKFTETSEKCKESESAIKSYEDEISNLKSKLKELNEQQLNALSQDELDYLRAQSAEYEYQIQLLEEKAELEKQNRDELASSLWQSDKKGKTYSVNAEGEVEENTTTGNYQSVMGTSFTKSEFDLGDTFNEQTEALEKLNAEYQKALFAKEQDINKIHALEQAIQKQRAEMAENAVAVKQVADSTTEYADEAQNSFNRYSEAIKVANTYTVRQSKLAQNLKESDDVYKALGHSASELAESFGDAEEDYERFQEYMANEDWASAYSLAVQYCVENTEELKETIESTLTELGNIEDAYKTLTSAVEEYNSGNVTLSTLETLLTKYPQYIQYLEYDGEQLRINKNGLDELANARVKELEMLAYQEYMAEEARIAEAELNGETLNAQSASQTFVSATKSEWLALNDIINALNKGEDAWDEYWRAESKGKYKKGSEYDKVHQENIRVLGNKLTMIQSVSGATNSYTSAIDRNTASTKKNTSATKDNNKALEEQIKQYEKVIKYIKSKFDEEIDRIKELKDTEIDSIKERIDALESLRDAELDAIQVKIDALNEENDALGEQLELQQLLDNLAKAKSSKVKIYRDGRFVYDQDQEQVSEAQKALNEYYAKKRLQDQIKALEDYKDSVKKNYDKQIDDLKAFQKEREKYYDAQIKYWQDYKKNFENMVNSYENEQNRLLALQMTGIDFEAQGWQSRLGNLQSFVNSYIDLLRQQVNATRSAQAEIEAIQSQGSGAPSREISNATTSGGTYYNLQSKGIKGSSSTATINGKSVLKPAYQNGGAKMISVAKKSSKITKHASGSNYIKADELAIVGEDPHKEIVIGSNLNTNSGVMMNLQKGSGVVPATATSSLMALADKIRANGVNATANDLTSSGEVVNMDIANVNVKADNADEFIQSMREFKLSMLQRTYK